jgi:hypothetical protein
MGTLFLLSGYFTPGSFARKGPGSFLKDRLLRLGIPLIIFIFVLNPITSIGYWQMPASLTGITTPLAWQAYPHLLGMGPLWFVAMLLIFDFGYDVWRMLTKNRTSYSMGKSSLPSGLLIGVFTLALALATLPEPFANVFLHRSTGNHRIYRKMLNRLVSVLTHVSETE